MKTKYFILSVLIIFGFQSCDVTDRIPEDAITDLNYWRKPDDLKMYARYFYTAFQSPSYHDATSDICVAASKDNTLFNNRNVPTGDDGWSVDDWANIRRCNYFMSHYQTVQGDQSEIDHYVGEVRFFRAYEYFNKVKRFGDVPWYDRDLQTNDTELLYKKRDSRSLVIGKIVEDLEFAATKMREPSKVSKGQLHKYAAYQMLARVCLYEATWMKYRNISGWETLMQKAATAAKVVMDCGLYSITPGTTANALKDYPLYFKAKFMQEDLAKDSECVLAREYRSVLSQNISRTGSLAISKDFIEQFLDIDGKPIALSSKYLGDDSIHMEMTNRDPRLRNIIANKYMPAEYKDGQLIYRPVVLIGSRTETESLTGYHSLKFTDPTQWNAGTGINDWYLFRYAEALLIYAEAKAELGECTQAVLDETVNKLRARMDEPGVTMGRLSVNPPADPLATVNGQPRYGYAVDPLLYEIRRERLVELAFEGFRWDDICRWKAGKLIENPKTMYGMAVNDAVIARYTEFNGGTNPFAGKNTVTVNDWDKTKQLLLVYEPGTTRTWNDRLYLDPLPQNQTTLNPNLLPQNPDW